MNTSERNREIAMGRYNLVRFVLDHASEFSTRSEACEYASRHPYTTPSNIIVRASGYTIGRWVRMYEKEGYDALIPKERSDAGINRKFTPEVKLEIIRLITEHPRIPCTVIHQKLIDRGFLSYGELSLSTITRFTNKARADLHLEKEKGERELRRYEKSHINEVWYGDSTNSVYITDESGKRRQVYIIAFIDDASRLITGCQAFFNDDTSSLIETVRSAVVRYGCPQLFSFDNGKNYRSHQIGLLAGRLGISVNYAPPYTPTSKGKVERFFLTLKKQWQSCLSLDERKDLNSLRASLSDYVHRYNHAPHSSLPNQCSPIERFTKEGRLVRCVDEEEVHELFLLEDQRKVSADGVIRMNSTEYETDYAFARRTVTVRYTRDYSEVYIQTENGLVPVQRLNKQENGDMHRRTYRFRSSLDVSAAEEADS